MQTASVGTITGLIGNNPDVVTIGDFLNGSRELEGDIDYIRITNGALAPAQFVTTIPTPAALPAGLALIALLAVRRRK